jgi:hypothetical protein
MLYDLIRALVLQNQQKSKNKGHLITGVLQAFGRIFGRLDTFGSYKVKSDAGQIMREALIGDFTSLNSTASHDVAGALVDGLAGGRWRRENIIEAFYHCLYIVPDAP